MNYTILTGDTFFFAFLEFIFRVFRDKKNFLLLIAVKLSKLFCQRKIVNDAILLFFEFATL